MLQAIRLSCCQGQQGPWVAREKASGRAILGEGNSDSFELTFPSMVTRGRGRPPHPDVLTPAEWGVLEMWRHGLGRSAIAQRRGISQYAVRYHLRNIAGKLGVEHYSELRH